MANIPLLILFMTAALSSDSFPRSCALRCLVTNWARLRSSLSLERRLGRRSRKTMNSRSELQRCSK